MNDRFSTCYGLMGPTTGGHEDAAASVLIRAIADWRLYADEEPQGEYCSELDKRGFRSARQELVRFWNSEDCKFLVESLLNYTHEEVLKVLGVPRQDDVREWGWAVRRRGRQK